MFQRARGRFEALITVIDEVLAAPEPEPVPHPHDRVVSLHRQRRAGSVQARELHCLCPVRRAAEPPDPRLRRDRVGG